MLHMPPSHEDSTLGLEALMLSIESLDPKLFRYRGLFAYRRRLMSSAPLHPSALLLHRMRHTSKVWNVWMLVPELLYQLDCVLFFAGVIYFSFPSPSTQFLFVSA